MPSTFRSFTGLDVPAFDSVYAEVEPRYEEKERRADDSHPFKLTLSNRLLMLLVYYRLYVTSRLVSFLFDLDHSNVLRDMRMLEPVVRELLPIPQKLHDRAERVVVEHTIALLKKFKIMGQEFRNRLRHNDITTDIVSGLINLRIMGTVTL